jgi:hypothetical protein
MAVPTSHYAHNAIPRDNFPPALLHSFLIASQEGRNLGRINYHFAHPTQQGGDNGVNKVEEKSPSLIGPQGGEGDLFQRPVSLE